jgi:hypothetical protein
MNVTNVVNTKHILRTISKTFQSEIEINELVSIISSTLSSYAVQLFSRAIKGSLQANCFPVSIP